MSPIGVTSTADVPPSTHSRLLYSQSDDTPGISGPLEHFKSDPASLGVVAWDGTERPQMVMDSDSGHPVSLHAYS